MKNKYNNLLKYIYDYSENTQHKETVNGLFRAILEPLIQNQKVEACVFIRILDKSGKDTSLKRLLFSNVKIYSFGNNLYETDFKDYQQDNLWDNTEFLVILGGRYSAALIWDYSDSGVKDNTRLCLLYNSKTILEIAKLIADNSKEDLTDIVKKYTPDRRENRLMNKSIQTIADLLNDKNKELIFSELEKNHLKTDEDTLKMAKIITENAKFTAHEIKNYLSIINLYSAIASKRFKKIKGDEQIIQSVENALTNITNASENISYLISDLRCMSSPLKQEINLKNLIESAIEMCKLRIEKNGTQLHYKNIENVIINTDKVTFQCAITNIIFNALDAKAKNITLETKNGNVLIKNDGEEIPLEIQDKIFEENFTTKEHGNGLGLGFCRTKLRQTGGDIKLISSDKKETVFCIFNK